MKLLYITPKIDEHDDDFAFSTQWVDAFIRKGYEVQVICHQKGVFDDRFPVYSLGKENGYSEFKIALRFLRFCLSNKYDRVFVHMNPKYFTVSGWWWYITKTPCYLWYTHYTTHLHLKIGAYISKRLFAATKQSLPQYNGSEKKVITGHGIDVRFWDSGVTAPDSASTNIVMVHRLARSKRVHLGIEALQYLPAEYNLTIYGRAVEPDYYDELQALVKKLGFEERVTFKGPVPMPDLRQVYPNHRLMINMAMETIDKTMVEAMVCGVFPIVTPGNAAAIKLAEHPDEETPQGIADFVLSEKWRALSQEKLKSIVIEHHGVDSLITKFDAYIQNGI